jgi:hypothetical protein
MVRPTPGPPSRRLPTIPALARRFLRAKTDDTQNKVLSIVLQHTANGAKTLFSDAVGRTIGWLMQRLRPLRHGDGNVARSQLSRRRAKAALATRETLIRQAPVGRHPSSVRRTHKIMKLTKNPNVVSLRSAQYYVQRSLKAGECTPKPDCVSKDNDSSYHRPWQ